MVVASVVVTEVVGLLVVVGMGGTPGGNPSLEPVKENNTKNNSSTMLSVCIKSSD